MKKACVLAVASGMTVALATGAWVSAQSDGDRRPSAGQTVAVGAPGTAELEVDAEAWIQRNPVASIRTPEQFGAVPHRFQREVFQSLKPDVQCGLWKSKLALILTLGELDDQQLGVVAMADCFLTPELYAKPLTDEAIAFLTNLETDARAVFSEKQFGSLFMLLGGAGLAPGTSASAPLELKAGECECNTGRDYCGGNRQCRRGGCLVTRGGCGFLWVYMCNGMCR
jgi:hypothetical protein